MGQLVHVFHPALYTHACQHLAQSDKTQSCFGVMNHMSATLLRRLTSGAM